MPEAPVPSAIELRDVEKQYGALRPLRVRDLRISAGSRTMLVGFDAPAAETFVNLVTGATLPDKGEVLSLGRRTSDISDGDAWLSFVEQFGFVSDRAVLLDAMTVAQNLALPFDLDVDPIPANVLPRVAQLAAEVGIDGSLFGAPVADAGPTVRAKVRVARALALDPAVLLLEHPTATLLQEDLKAYSELIKRISERREITIVGLTMDEQFGKAIDGRLLSWQPANGEFQERRGWFSR